MRARYGQLGRSCRGQSACKEEAQQCLNDAKESPRRDRGTLIHRLRTFPETYSLTDFSRMTMFHWFSSLTANAGPQPFKALLATLPVGISGSLGTGLSSWPVASRNLFSFCFSPPLLLPSVCISGNATSIPHHIPLGTAAVLFGLPLSWDHLLYCTLSSFPLAQCPPPGAPWPPWSPGVTGVNMVLPHQGRGWGEVSKTPTSSAKVKVVPGTWVSVIKASDFGSGHSRSHGSEFESHIK